MQFKILVNFGVSGVTSDIRSFSFTSPRKGDTVAFYMSEEIDNYYAATVSLTLRSDKVHLLVYEPNGATIRKRVSPVTTSSFKNRWLPIKLARSIEDLSDQWDDNATR